MLNSVTHFSPLKNIRMVRYRGGVLMEGRPCLLHPSVRNDYWSPKQLRPGSAGLGMLGRSYGGWKYLKWLSIEQNQSTAPAIPFLGRPSQLTEVRNQEQTDIKAILWRCLAKYWLHGRNHYLLIFSLFHKVGHAEELAHLDVGDKEFWRQRKTGRLLKRLVSTKIV